MSSKNSLTKIVIYQAKSVCICVTLKVGYWQDFLKREEPGCPILLEDYTYLTRFACVIAGENFGRTLRRTEITGAPFQATCPKVGNKQVKSTWVLGGIYKPQGSENWGTRIIPPSYSGIEISVFVVTRRRLLHDVVYSNCSLSLPLSLYGSEQTRSIVVQAICSETR